MAVRDVPQSAVRMISEAPRQVASERQQLVQGRFDWKSSIGDLDGCGGRHTLGAGYVLPH